MLSSRMPELSALETLAAIARTGSVNAAARELGRTQQAVSSRLAALEAQVGLTLVMRSPRGSSLTSSGIVVTNWANRVLDVAAELDAGLAALRQEQRGHLVIAASLTIAERLMPTWLVALNGRPAPGSGAAPARGSAPASAPVQATLLAVNSEQVAALVRGGEADVGFVEGPAAPRGARSRIIGADELLVVAPGHPWARRRAPIDAALLAATPLVSRERGSGTRDALEAALRRRLGVEAAIAAPELELPSTAAIRTAVIAGVGAAVLSRLAVGDDLATGRLAQVGVADVDLRRSLRAVWRGGGSPPAGPVRDIIGIAASSRIGGASSATSV